MSSTEQSPGPVEQIEALVDSGFEAAVSWLTMTQQWTKIMMSAASGYSPSTEAANLLARTTRGQGRGQHAEQD